MKVTVFAPCFLLSLFLGLQLPTATAQEDLNKGKLIYLPFDSSGANKSVNRLQNTDAQFQGVSFSTGFDGKSFGAAFFDGKSQGRIALNPQSPAVSVSLWFNTEDAQKKCVLAGCDKKGYGLSLSLGGKLSTYLHLTSGQVYSYEHPRNLADGRWHHVLLTFDGHFFAVYIDSKDGIPVFEDNQFGPNKQIRFESSGLNLGAMPSDPNPYHFTGLLDELLVFNRALSRDAVRILANKSKINAEESLDYSILRLDFEQYEGNTSILQSEEIQIVSHGGSFARNNCLDNGYGGTYMRNLGDDQSYISGGVALELPKFTFATGFSTHTVKESFLAGWDTTGYRIVLNPKGHIGKLQALVWTSAKDIIVLDAPETLNDGVCHFVALSFDGQTAKLYLDGKLSDEKKAASTPKTAGAGLSSVYHAASTFLIGRERERKPLLQFLGKVDGVRLYNRALSHAEIKTLTEAPPAPKPNYRVFEVPQIANETNATTAFVSAANPTGQEATLLIQDAKGTKILNEKIKPGGQILKALTVRVEKNWKFTWKH